MSESTQNLKVLEQTKDFNLQLMEALRHQNNQIEIQQYKIENVKEYSETGRSISCVKLPE